MILVRTCFVLGEMSLLLLKFAKVNISIHFYLMNEWSMILTIKARFILFGPPKLLAQTLLELKMTKI